MSLLARFAPPSMTAEQYDAIVARLYEEGIHPAPGLELEVIRRKNSRLLGLAFSPCWLTWGWTLVSRRWSKSTMSFGAIRR